MRLIDADAYAYPGDLVNEPTIDAVIVVRCEYCKKWKRTENCRHGICRIEGVELFRWQHDYCSYGERRVDHEP